MSVDLVQIRMVLTGGKQVAAESKAAASGIASTGVAAETAGKKTAASSSAISKSLRQQSTMMKQVGRGWSTYVSLPLVGAGYLAIKTAADFDRSMAQVGIALKLTGRGMEGMRDLALDMGAKTIFSANDSAEAMLNLAKAGMTPAQIRGGALAATMNLAAAGGENLADAGNLVGAAMNTFSLKASEATRIADALAGGANASSADVSDLSQSLTQAGQSAAMMDLSLFETVGTLAAFADQGLRGSDAGTSLKTFLLRLNPTTKKAREEMNELGLSFFDSNGKMVGLAEVSARLRHSLSDLSDEQRGQALSTIFGSDAIRAANIIYNAGPAGIRRYTKATEERGAAEKMAAAQMEGLPGALERLKGSLETAALVAGDAAAPAIIFLAGGLEGLANSFTGLDPAIQTGVVALGAVVAIAGPVIWALGSMAAAYERLGLAGTGAAGRLGKRGLIAGGVGAAAMLGGSAIGGDVGSLVSNIGGGAALGFSVGGPLGAAVGGTAGAILTALPQWEALFKAEKRLGPVQSKLAASSADLTMWWKRQRSASAGLVGATDRVHRADRRLDASSRHLKTARQRLTAVVQEYGRHSRPALRAETRLTEATDAHRRAIKRLENAQRLRGTSLSAYKTITNQTVLAERHRINVLNDLAARQGRLYREAKAANPQSQRTLTLAENYQATLGKLSGAQQRQARTLQDAAQKGGRRYADFLRNGSQEALRFGGEMKAIDVKVRGLTEHLRELGEQSARQPSLPSLNAPSPFPGRHKVPHGARGFTDFPGGLAVVGEEGPELVRLPRHADVLPSERTRRLLRGGDGDVQGSSRVAALTSRSRQTRTLQPVQFKVGRRVLAEAVVEIQEDDEARL